MKRLSRLTGVSVIVASLLNLVASSVYAFSYIQTHWAKGCITQLEPRNLVAGYPDGTFRPGLTITRAEFAALMLKAFPKAPIVRRAMTFEDVPIMHWAYKVIQEAYKRGFFTGYPGGNFQPSEPITRVQAIGVLAGALKYSIPSNPDAILQQNYFDAAAIPNYARKAVAAASVNNLVVNYPNRNQLNPNQQATRGEIAALLCRSLNIYAVAPQYIAGAEIYPQQVRERSPD